MLTQERLRHLMDYDPETGTLTRRVRGGTQFPGKTARTCVGGYLTCMIDRKMYKVHRLVWLYVHGEFPPGHLDHRNGNRSDNRIENLRLASRGQNNKNARLRKDSKSGYKGVSWKSRTRRWIAQIQVDGVKKHIGYFTTAEDAAKAYDEAAVKYHGEFAKTNSGCSSA